MEDAGGCDMTLEEIEARWKAATPGPWKASTDPIPRIDDAQNNPVYWCDSYESYPICSDDLRAIAAAPTDIAYLLDRVRECENELVECGRRESVERALAHVRSARVHELEDRVRKLERAHAWFVENTEYGMSSDEGGGLICHCGYYEPFSHEPKKHEPDCEWVKAKDLRL